MKKTIIFILTVSILLIPGCSGNKKHNKSVYMLLDTSGTYALELDKAHSVIKYLLGILQPTDTLAVARIDTGSFSEKDIIAKVKFDQRPSVANDQKRAFVNRMDEFVKNVKSAQYTDIEGGLLQAIDYLNETAAGEKYIIIFSDLKQELASGHIRGNEFDLTGFEVIALNVTKLNEDIREPDNYMSRVAEWKARIEKSGGVWKRINEMDHIDQIFKG
ncbi:MAG: VWA domain-containing protein [Deltaproteobacteria bacterium]|nr:VWA domain-containing protein [Deltaproteobacteria bacterium]